MNDFGSVGSHGKTPGSETPGSETPGSETSGSETHPVETAAHNSGTPAPVAEARATEAPGAEGRTLDVARKSVVAFFHKLGRAVADGFFAPSAPYNLAVARVLVFGYLAYRGYSYTSWYKFGKHSWAPISFFAALDIPLLPEPVVTVMVPLLRLTAVCAALGVAYRWTAWFSTVCFWYLAGTAQCFGKVDHADNALALSCAILSLAFATDVWSVPQFLRRKQAPTMVAPSPEYRWPLQLMLLVVGMMYFAAGWNKHARAGWNWALSDNMLRQMLAHEFSRDPPTNLGVFLSGYPLVCKAMGLWALVVELAAPLALLHRRLGYFMVLNLMALQLGIYLTLGVYFGGMIPVFLSQMPWNETWQRGRHLAARFRRTARV